MPLLVTEAAKLTNNDLVAGVIEEIIDRDELFARLPFTRVDGRAYVYNRENTISEADFLDPNDTVNEGAATFTEVTTNLRALIGDVDVDKFLDTVYNNTNNQRAIQISMKAKAMARKFQRTLILGDNSVNSKEFSGIGKMSLSSTPYPQLISAGGTGSALTLTMLDELCDAVINKPDALIMRPSVLRAYRTLLRAQGGSTADSSMIGNFGLPIPMHNGVPILLNDYIPATETYAGAPTGGSLTSVYAIRFNEADGLHGLFGGDNAGIVVEDLGTVQNRDASRTRLKWYCGLALKSTRSLARLKGLTNV